MSGHGEDRRRVVRWPRIALLCDSILKYVVIEGVDVFPFRGADLEDLIAHQIHHRITDWRRYDMVFIHAGTNDIANGKLFLINKIAHLIELISEVNPGIDVILSSILPRPCDIVEEDLKKDQYTQYLIEVNRRVKAWSKKSPGVHFVTSFKTFIRQGRVRTDQKLFAVDQLHLSRKGTWRMERIFKTYAQRYVNGTVPFGIGH